MTQDTVTVVFPLLPNIDSLLPPFLPFPSCLSPLKYCSTDSSHTHFGKFSKRELVLLIVLVTLVFMFLFLSFPVKIVPCEQWRHCVFLYRLQPQTRHKHDLQTCWMQPALKIRQQCLLSIVQLLEQGASKKVTRHHHLHHPPCLGNTAMACSPGENETPGPLQACKGCDIYTPSVSPTLSSELIAGFLRRPQGDSDS